MKIQFLVLALGKMVIICRGDSQIDRWVDREKKRETETDRQIDFDLYEGPVMTCA